MRKANLMKQSHLKFLIVSMLVAGAGSALAAGSRSRIRQSVPVQQDEQRLHDQLDVQQNEHQHSDGDNSRNMDTTHDTHSSDHNSEQAAIRDLEHELSRNLSSSSLPGKDKLNQIQ